MKYRPFHSLTLATLILIVSLGSVRGFAQESELAATEDAPDAAELPIRLSKPISIGLAAEPLMIFMLDGAFMARLQGSYNLSHWFAVELRYSTLGMYEPHNDSENPPDAAMLHDVGLSAKFYLMSTPISPYIRLDFDMFMKSSYSWTAFGPALGVEYVHSSGFGGFFDISAYWMSDSHGGFIEVPLVYKMSLGICYRF